MICIVTLVIRKDMTFAVALLSVYGLAMYGMYKKKLFTIRTRSMLIAVAALFFAGTARRSFETTQLTLGRLRKPVLVSITVA